MNEDWPGGVRGLTTHECDKNRIGNVRGFWRAFYVVLRSMLFGSLWLKIWLETRCHSQPFVLL